MEIRPTTSVDKDEIIDLYKRSQAATGLPAPSFLPPDRLGDHLYARQVVERYVATQMGRIVGHALIERPNPAHIDEWC